MNQKFPRFGTEWEEDARWHNNGLPANMAAVLHDQWKRSKSRRLRELCA